MSTTGRRSASAAATSRTAATVAPAASARALDAAAARPPPRERARAGRLDDRPVGERVGEGHAELDEVGATVGVRLPDRARGPDVREAAHEVRHQRGALAGAREGGPDPVDARVHERARTSARSLSPRPE